MKYLITSFLFSIALAMTALAEMKVEVECTNTSGLPSGLSVTILSDESSGDYVVEMSNRDNLGPYMNLGTLAVVRKKYPEDTMDAPITYVGDNFRLDIFWGGGPDDGSFPSQVSAVVQGRTFKEPMNCRILD